MKTDTFFFVGGCSGGYPTPTEPVPTWVPGNDSAKPYTRRTYFNREVYGSRTTNFLVGCGDHYFIVDQGSGITFTAKILLEKLKAEEKKTASIDVLMTHWHRDHIEGIIQNSLLFNPNLTLRFFSPDLSPWNRPIEGREPWTIERLIAYYFDPDRGIWPVRLEELASTRTFVDFRPGDNLFAGAQTNIPVTTLPLIHKGGCCGYRLNLPNEDTVAVLTDHEPTLEPDPAIVELLEGTTLAVLDMQYSDPEYAGEVPIAGLKRSRESWGHGTPKRWFSHLFACARPPKRVLITHHDPGKSDTTLNAFQDEARGIGIRLNADRPLPFDFQFACGGELYWL